MKKRYALVASEREKECPHVHVPFTGSIPCTGPRVCSMCGTRFEPDGVTLLRDGRPYWVRSK